MHVISKRTLTDFGELPNRQDAREPLDAWYREAKRAKWNSFGDVKRTYASASVVANDRVVFNIHGNKYRLIVALNYAAGIVYIKFIGTHAQYDQIDASTI
jgi:mRNA interferase HigB